MITAPMNLGPGGNLEADGFEYVPTKMKRIMICGRKVFGPSVVARAKEDLTERARA